MTDYEIFRCSFPEYNISEPIFTRLAFPDGCKCFRTEGGFAVADGDRITMLCVAPQYQKKGIGSALLAECEAYLSAIGCSTARLSGELICGALNGSEDFFKKHGYNIGECRFNEMQLDLSRYSRSLFPPENVTFGFFEGNTEVLRHAVNEVDEEWVQYFDGGSEYLCGFAGGEIASFCIVDKEADCLLSDGSLKIGSVGCVGTVPKFRSRGIGLATVDCACDYLRKNGCDRVFIHYTHLDKWYGRLGAKVFQRFRTAEKKLK